MNHNAYNTQYYIRYNHRLKNILKNYDIVQFLLLQKFCTMVNTSIYLSMINNTQTTL